MKKITAAILGGFLSILLHANASAQSDEFKYQGNLVFNGQPANGSYDFEFRLFSTFVGGTQIGSTATHTGVQVTNGNFVVSLLFDDGFDGTTRYLDISVRPAGSGSYTALTPRTLIGTTPYAMRSTYALVAQSAVSAETAVSAQTAAFAENAGSAITAGSADVATNATNAGTASNALALGGLAPNQYVLTNDPRLTDTRPPAPGSTNYIHNGTTQQPASNFNISGNGLIGGNLTVGGNISVASSTRYFAIPGGAFQPLNSNMAFAKDFFVEGTGTIGSAANFIAHLNLPHGATVTSFTVFAIDENGSEDMIVEIMRHSTSSLVNNTTIASIITSGSSSNPREFSDTSITNPVVDNQNFLYSIRANWTVPSVGTDMLLMGVRVTYVVNNPLP